MVFFVQQCMRNGSTHKHLLFSVPRFMGPPPNSPETVTHKNTDNAQCLFVFLAAGFKLCFHSPACVCVRGGCVSVWAYPHGPCCHFNLFSEWSVCCCFCFFSCLVQYMIRQTRCIYLLGSTTVRSPPA